MNDSEQSLQRRAGDWPLPHFVSTTVTANECSAVFFVLLSMAFNLTVYLPGRLRAKGIGTGARFTFLSQLFVECTNGFDKVGLSSSPKTRISTARSGSFLVPSSKP